MHERQDYHELSQDALNRLKDVRQLILDEPSRLRMAMWASLDDGPTCKTTGCIAGWLVLRHEMKAKGMNAEEAMNDSYTFSYEHGYGFEEHARDLLGLTYEEGVALFFHYGWPPEYQARYDDRGDMVLDDVHIPISSSIGGKQGVLDARVANAKLVAELLDSVIEKRRIWWKPDLGPLFSA